MQVVAVQLDTVWEDKAASFARAQSLLEAARIEPGALVVLPEMFATGFSMDVAAIAEGPARPAERFLADLARRRRCFTLGGVVTTAGGEGGGEGGQAAAEANSVGTGSLAPSPPLGGERAGVRGAKTIGSRLPLVVHPPHPTSSPPSPQPRGQNEAVLFGPQGRELARYRKMHPFSAGREKDFFDAGGRVVTFPWAGLTVAPLICYDLRFPELFRAAVRRGAELLVLIANWPAARVDHWTTLLRARAIENQAYVVGVNRAGADPKLEYPGASLIVGPRGEILAQAGPQPTVLTADLSPAPLREYRAAFPALGDMRPDLLPDGV